MSRQQNDIRRLKQELSLGICTTLTSFGLFAWLQNEITSTTIMSLDTSISQFFYSSRTPMATGIMTIFSLLGVQFTIIFFLVTILYLLRKNHTGDVTLFSTILILGGTVNITLKDIIARPRPTLSPLFIIENDFSFPSAHAMNSFLFYVTASYIVFHITRNQRESAFVTVFSILLVFMVGISRIYLGVHYPSDVLAGYLAGLGWFCAILSLEKAYLFFHTSR